MARLFSLHGLRTDIIQGVRTLVKSPRFTIPALSIIALGIFTATLVFSIFDSVILNALPYSHADRMVALFGTSERASGSQFPLSRGEVEQLQNDASIFARIGYYVYLGDKHLTDSGVSSRVGSLQVSPDFFRVFNVDPVLGRLFGPEQFQAGKSDAVIISYGLWRQKFSSDPQVIGRVMHLDGTPYTIVGVMPEKFRFPTPEVSAWFPDPVSPLPDKAGDKLTVALIRPGNSLAQVEAALAVLSAHLRQGPLSRPVFPDFTISAVRLQDQVAGNARRILLLLMLAVALVQIIVCTNVANLLLARNALRKKEVAIRIALGASRLRVIQELLVESLLLGLGGCALALLGATVGIQLISVTFAPSLANSSPLVMDFFVVGTSLMLSLFSGITFGLLPAIRATSVSPSHVLQEGASGSRGGFGLLRGHRLQSTLTVSQITVALVLLIGFGLLLRSLSRIMNVDPGFDPKKLIAIQLGPIRWGQQTTVGLNQVVANIRRLPAVQSVAISSMRPLMGVSISTLFSAQTTDGAWVSGPAVEAQAVSADYFRTLKIPILAGRTFDDHDTYGSPCVVVVSSALAKVFWSDNSPLERQIDLNGGIGGPPALCRVIGVVGNVKDVFLQEGAGHPEIYFGFAQKGLGTHALLIRTDEHGFVSPNEILGAAHAIDASLDAESIEGLDQVIANSAYQPRLRATVVGLFALLAAALAITGLYGATSHSVGQRTREFGIRVALGATRADLVQMVLHDCIVLVGAGIAIGSLAALAVSRVFGSMLYEVRPTDLLTYVFTGALLTVVALTASFFPARRATKLSPNVALRDE